MIRAAHDPELGAGSEATDYTGEEVQLGELVPVTLQEKHGE